MKKSAIMCLAAAMVIGLMGYETLAAEAKATAEPAKIALVSVRAVFQNCKKNKDYTEKQNAEKDKAIADLKKIEADTKAIQADLETRKPNSEEYLKLLKDLSEKKAFLDGQKQYYQEQFKVRDQIWTEKMYKEVLDVVGQVAKQKGYNLVLDKDEVELPASSPTELMLIIRTHKVLYYKDDLDITSDVLAAVDAQQAGTAAGTQMKTAK